MHGRNFWPARLDVWLKLQLSKLPLNFPRKGLNPTQNTWGMTSFLQQGIPTAAQFMACRKLQQGFILTSWLNKILWTTSHDRHAAKKLSKK